jgi:hypothetical protein
MPSFNITDAPEYLTMNDFRAVSDDYGGLIKSCKFAVRIVPQGEYISNYGDFARNLTYLCEIAEMPGRGFMSLDVRYYGPNQKLPFQTTYEDMTLTFLCRAESIERQFFDDWMLVINPTNTFDFNYRDDYKSEITIYQFADFSEYEDDDHPIASYCITLHNAYPILLNPQPMTWADDQFQRLSVSFTYTHWSRKRYDPPPGANKLIEDRNVDDRRPLFSDFR